MIYIGLKNQELEGNQVLDMNEIIQKTIQAAQIETNDYTYPIFIADEAGKPDLIASSLIIEVDEKSYLVTAAHVLKEVLSVGSPFLVGVNTKYLPIKGEFTYSVDEPSDNFDVAFVELDKDMIKSNNIKALPFEKLFQPSDKKPHIAFVHGFPNSKNKQAKALRNTTAFRVKAYAYGGVIKNEDIEWSKYEKDPDTHICMSYANTSDNNIPTHPRGISGGGLWVVPHVINDLDVKLYGVFIEYYKKDKVSFSTEIRQVVDFIKNA
jgi:hypothetical protein